MARYSGSSSTKEAKTISDELEQLGGRSYKYNFDYLRLIELLLAYRVAEQVCSYNADSTIEEKTTSVEIPLIGELTIKPRNFHSKHRLTEEPSVHFDFEFKPTSGFKSDIMKAYTDKSSSLTEILSNVYGDRLDQLYKRLKEEGV